MFYISFLQKNCNRQGFNVRGDGRHPNSPDARIGIIANNEDECVTCDSRLGFGTARGLGDSNTCGNYCPFYCQTAVKAFGYILVQ